MAVNAAAAPEPLMREATAAGQRRNTVLVYLYVDQ